MLFHIAPQEEHPKDGSFLAISVLTWEDWNIYICLSLAGRHLWASTISLISHWNAKGIKFIPICMILKLLHHLANYSHVNTRRLRPLYSAELQVHQYKRKMTCSRLVRMVTWLKLPSSISFCCLKCYYICKILLHLIFFPHLFFRLLCED